MRWLRYGNLRCPWPVEIHAWAPLFYYSIKTLQKISYFSLIGGYKDLFKHKASGNYLHGVTFEEIVSFYYFDESLRTLFLKYILQVERQLKSMLSYSFCEKYSENQSAYLDFHNYNISRYRKI